MVAKTGFLIETRVIHMVRVPSCDRVRAARRDARLAAEDVRASWRRALAGRAAYWATESLAEMALLKRSRLSVVPVTAKEWAIVLRASKTKL